MQTSIIIQCLFYFVSITLHSTYAVVIGVLTHKGLLTELIANRFLISLGAFGAILLTLLFIFTIWRHLRTDVQLAFIFIFMVVEIVFVGIIFSGNQKVKCKAEPSGRPTSCSFRPAIFGLAFAADITLGVYFFAMLISSRFAGPGMSSALGNEVNDVERGYTRREYTNTRT